MAIWTCNSCCKKKTMKPCVFDDGGGNVLPTGCPGKPDGDIYGKSISNWAMKIICVHCKCEQECNGECVTVNCKSCKKPQNCDDASKAYEQSREGHHG